MIESRYGVKWISYPIPGTTWFPDGIELGGKAGYTSVCEQMLIQAGGIMYIKAIYDIIHMYCSTCT